MKPTNFKLSNGVLRGGPREKYGTDDDVLDLPICQLAAGTVVSCWRPSLRERLQMLFSGRVWVHVHAPTHPPIALSGDVKYLRLTRDQPAGWERT